LAFTAFTMSPERWRRLSLYAECSALRKTLSGATDVPDQEAQSPSVICHSIR
jgi:hypothetical protein